MGGVYFFLILDLFSFLSQDQCPGRVEGDILSFVNKHERLRGGYRGFTEQSRVANIISNTKDLLGTTILSKDGDLRQFLSRKRHVTTTRIDN